MIGEGRSVARKHIQRSSSGHQADLAKVLRQIANRHSLWAVFRDFVAMSALALSNAADPWQRQAREAEYMAIVGRYSREEADLMARAFALVVEGLETGHQDFLGSLFMNLELSDSWKGQFFTPYEVSLLMARMNMHDVHGYIEKNGFVRVSDPCVGGGAMVIAAAHAMLDVGLPYQRHMHAVAQDIDLTAVHMSYIQFTLLHIPAVVVHGDSLSREVRSTWRTLAHTMGRWDSKLERRRLADAAVLADANLIGPPAPEPVVTSDDQEPGPVAPALFVPSAEALLPPARPAPSRPSRPSRHSVADQFSLF